MSTLRMYFYDTKTNIHIFQGKKLYDDVLYICAATHALTLITYLDN